MAGFDEAGFEEFYSDTLPASTLEKPHQFEKAEDLGITTVTAKERSLEKVIQYVSGYPWRVTYYNNMSDRNDRTSNTSVELDKTIQRYKKYKSLTIYLESGLDIDVPSLDNIELSGTVNSGFIPFQYDTVIVPMVGSRKGIFTVSEVENVTYLQHTVYKIKLKFKTFTDMAEELVRDLEDKTIQTFVEDRNYITDYGAPLILEEQYKNKMDLKQNRLDLIKLYLDLFYDQGEKYLGLLASPIKAKNEEGLLSYVNYTPKSRPNIIDEYISKFFRNCVDTEEDFRIVQLRWPSYVQAADRSFTILDGIIKQDVNYRYNCDPNLGFIRPFINFLPEQQLPFAMNVDVVVDRLEVASQNQLVMTKDAFIRPEINSPIDYPLNKTQSDLYYIFSKAFYTEDLDKMTKFELIVRRFLNEESVSVEELIPYIYTAKLWSRYEQFYIIPILIYLINYLTKNTYSPS